MDDQLSEEQERIRTLASQITGLPALPLIASELLEAVDDPDTSAAKMAALISSDPGLATRLLKLANSAFYGFPKRIGTVNLAVVVLGFETVRDLCLSVLIADCFYQGDDELPFEMEAFWRHSLLSAIAARMVYKMSGATQSGEGFIAGLVHDVGKLLLGRYYSDLYVEVTRRVVEEKQPLLDAERTIFGLTHATAGAWLLKEWNLPDWLVNAVEIHHLEMDDQMDSLSHSVAFADMLVRKRKGETNFIGVIREPSLTMEKALNLKQDEEGDLNWEYYLDALQEELSRSEGFINVIRKPVAEYAV
jgi:HD-like signal output (HDOD) protein